MSNRTTTAVAIEALKRACDRAGGQSALGRAIGRAQQTINNWLNGKGAAANSVLEIEKATGVSRHDLRPDIYPRERRAS